MLYSEFIEGTGCKDNHHNFKVFQDLEVMYMNSDISKEQVYEYGKKLVKNDIREVYVHPLEWLVVNDAPYRSYVAASFMIKESAELYVEKYRSVGKYRVIHESVLSAEYDQVITQVTK